MDDCVAFLDAHPTESIFMRIAEAHEAEGNTRSFQATLMDYLDNYPPERIWETDDWSRLPTLGEIRGKIVIIGGSNDPELPQCSYKGIFDNYDEHIIDFWDKKDSYNTLWGEIKDHLIKANADRSSPKAFSTFISDYAYPITPWDVADRYDGLFVQCDGMNRRTYRYLRDLLNQGKYHRIGHVMMDFPGKGLIDNIIAHNGLDRLLTNDPPEADAGGPYIIDECSTILLDGSGSTDYDGDPLYYQWDFYGDGTWDTEWLDTPYVTFEAGDNMDTKVILRVWDGTGFLPSPTDWMTDGMDEDGATLTIQNVAPGVVIDEIQSKIPGCIMPGHEVVFFGSFSDPGYMDTHIADWYFSEGGIAGGTITGENDPPDATGLTQTTNSYTALGIYSVTLVVTDDDDGTGWATTEVLVRTPAQVCEFMIDFILSLDNQAFNNPAKQHQKALFNKLRATEHGVQRGQNKGQCQRLINDLRMKWDGSVDGDSKDDWIIDPDAQALLCLTTDELILYLENGSSKPADSRRKHQKKFRF